MGVFPGLCRFVADTVNHLVEREGRGAPIASE
jgi:hypothetical protein